MSATASRIAPSASQSVPGVQGHHPVVPKPSTVTTAVPRTLPRDRTTGRFVAPAPIPTCAACRYTLAEDLAGRLYCPHRHCESYRQPVDVVAGVRLGVLTAGDLEVAR